MAARLKNMVEAICERHLCSWEEYYSSFFSDSDTKIVDLSTYAAPLPRIPCLKKDSIEQMIHKKDEYMSSPLFLVSSSLMHTVCAAKTLGSYGIHAKVLDAESLQKSYK